MRCISLLLFVLLTAAGCSKSEDEGPGGKTAWRSGKRKVLSPREGVWRTLKLMEASLNQRNLQGYLRVFGGLAGHEVRKQLSGKKFRSSAGGRYRLTAFRIVKRHSRAVVTVQYTMSRRIPGQKERIIKGEGIFSAAPGLKHWVIISF